MSEIQIVSFFNHLGQGTFVDSLAAFASNISVLILLWAVLIALSFYEDKKNGKIFLLSSIVAIIIYFVINDFIFKYIIADVFGLMRIRPYLASPEEIIPIGMKFTDSSFPSGHMASTIAVLGVLISFYKKYWIPILFFILFMAFARMHQGMHYPSDVLVGSLLGIFYAFAGIKLAKKILKKKKKAKKIGY